MCWMSYNNLHDTQPTVFLVPPKEVGHPDQPHYHLSHFKVQTPVCPRLVFTSQGRSAPFGLSTARKYLWFISLHIQYLYAVHVNLNVVVLSSIILLPSQYSDRPQPQRCPCVGAAGAPLPLVCRGPFPRFPSPG